MFVGFPVCHCVFMCVRVFIYAYPSHTPHTSHLHLACPAYPTHMHDTRRDGACMVGACEGYTGRGWCMRGVYTEAYTIIRGVSCVFRCFRVGGVCLPTHTTGMLH